MAKSPTVPIPTPPPPQTAAVEPLRKPAVAPAVQISGSDAAPDIYFDTVVAFGLVNGIVQLELCTQHLIPVPNEPQPRGKLVVRAHMRCSPNAAMDLLNTLTKALEFLKPAASPPSNGGGDGAAS